MVIPLHIRSLEHSDYDELLVGWWKDWGFGEAPPRDFLPADATGGMMVMAGNTPVCAGFMYATNAKVAWIDWIVSNKSYTDRRGRKRALRILVDALTNICRNAGYEYAYALFNNRFLPSVFTDLGYTQGDTFRSEMIKKLQ